MQQWASPSPRTTQYIPVRYLHKATYHTKPELIQGSPSRQDGLAEEKEVSYRRITQSFMVDLSARLKLPQWVVWTATVFMNRFYRVKSYQKNDRFIFGAAAILLATKVEECPRSVRDVSLASWEYRVKAARRAEAAALREYLGNQSFMGELQEKVLLAERVLLFAMGFNLGVGSQPIVLMASFLAEFKHAAFTSAVQASLQGPPEKHLTLLPEVIVQKILSFHNDCGKTLLQLQYPAELMVPVFVHTATQLHRYQLPMLNDMPLLDAMCVPAVKARMTRGQWQDIYDQLFEVYDDRAAGQPAAAGAAAAVEAAVVTAEAAAVQSPQQQQAQAVPRAESPEEGEVLEEPQQQEQQQRKDGSAAANQGKATSTAPVFSGSVNGGQLEDSANELAASPPNSVAVDGPEAALPAGLSGPMSVSRKRKHEVDEAEEEGQAERRVRGMPGGSDVAC